MINFQKAEFLTSIFDYTKINLVSKPEIVFVGRSNVGKSSMINALLNRKALARTSSTPGKTVCINFYDINQEIYLCDLPGYGYAQRAKNQREDWKVLIEGYFNSQRDIRLVVMLVDLRHPATKDDKVMYEYLTMMDLPFCITGTKADKLSKTAIIENTERLCQEFDVQIIPFSAQTKYGVEELKTIINQMITQQNKLSCKSHKDMI